MRSQHRQRCVERNETFLMFWFLLFVVTVTAIQFSPEDIQLLYERVNRIQLNPSQLSNFHSQLSIGIALREDFDLLSKNLQQEDHKILEIKSQLLQRSYQKLLEMTDPFLPKKVNRAATIAAIQRGKQRRIEMQHQVEDEKLTNEHLLYVSNLRKLELVDGTIQTLRHRALSFELSDDRKLFFPPPFLTSPHLTFVRYEGVR
jgi:hypothetical protein